MKITIYELLGLIKDDKAPKKIKYQNYKWVWTGDDYKTIKGVKECFLITGQEYTWVTEFLNDEVEIIEEEKDIEKIDIYDSYTNHQNLHTYINTYDDKDGKEKKFVVGAVQRETIIKLNEIIDELNKLKGAKND